MKNFKRWLYGCGILTGFMIIYGVSGSMECATMGKTEGFACVNLGFLLMGVSGWLFIKNERG